MSRFIAALLCVLWLAPANAAEADDAPLPVTQVAPGVYVHRGQVADWLPANGGDVANIGFIVGTRCVAVVDSGGSLAIGKRLRARIAATTSLPVCQVINTHAHPDHMLGDAAFVGGTTRFAAHARYAAALSAREGHLLNAVARDFGQTMTHEDIVYPSLAVKATTELDLGDRRIVLRAWPTAHTDNDLTVYDPQTKTLFLGDLLFAEHLPVVDGSLRGWLSTMAELRAMDVAVAIPGHGTAAPGWPAALNAQQRYLDTLLRETRAAIKSRIPIRQAVDASVPDMAGEWKLLDLFHKRNVTAAYAELEWEE